MLKKILIFIPLYCVWVMVALAFSFGLFTARRPDGSVPDVPFIAVILYLVLIMVPIWLFTKWLNYVPAWVNQVKTEGKAAPATILSVKEAGIVINRTIDVINVRLRVEPADEAPFEVTQQKQVSLLMGLGAYSPGAHIRVKYDPNNKKHVVILSDADTVPDSRTTPDYSARPSSAVAQSFNSMSDVTHNLAELSKLHKSGELSDSEFEAAKKKLLS